jgi:hypothetical protein
MLAVGAPFQPPRGLMSVEASAFTEFDPHTELRRLLWGVAAVLGSLLVLWHAAAR